MRKPKLNLSGICPTSVEKIMRKTMAIKVAATRQQIRELSEVELEKVSGGLSCCRGEHLKQGVIVVR